jgi:hypothetical protein
MGNVQYGRGIGTVSSSIERYGLGIDPRGGDQAKKDKAELNEKFHKQFFGTVKADWILNAGVGMDWSTNIIPRFPEFKALTEKKIK